MTTLIWGSTFVVVKDVLDQWPPLFYITSRFVISGAVLLLLFPKFALGTNRKELLSGVTLGLLLGGGFALQTFGQVYTTPSKSAFITGLTTPLVPFAALILLKVRPNTENLIGVVLASTGGILILAPTQAEAVNKGDLLTLGCTVLFAVHITLMSVYSRQVDLRRLTVLQINTVAVIFLGLFASVLAISLFKPEALAQFVFQENLIPAISGRVAAQVVYLAVVATVITFLFWTWGQSRVSATHAAIIFALEPVFATIFAVIVRGSGEFFGVRGSIGAALILAGVIVSELRLGRKPSTRIEEIHAEDVSLAEDI